jgi:hypothetical protein
MTFAHSPIPMSVCRVVTPVLTAYFAVVLTTIVALLSP